MATVDTLLVRIEADMRDLQKDLRKIQTQTAATTTSMSKNFMKVKAAIGVLAGAVVIRQIARVGTSLINLAGDAQEMQSMSEAVFGDYVHDIRQFADETAKATGRSRFELEEMAATVQDTFVPLGFARGEAAEMAKQLTLLSVDVGSFKNTLDVNVMNAFQSALVGNHEAVRRFGIVITEAELQQELYRMGIRKSKDEVTAQEKAMARFNLILAGTKDAQGDAARTAGSFANQSKNLSATLKDLGTELGQVLIPAALSLVTTLRDLAAGFRQLAVDMNLIGETPAQRLETVRKSAESAQKSIAELNDKIARGQRGFTREGTAGKTVKTLTEILKKAREEEAALMFAIEKREIAMIEASKSTEKAAAPTKKFDEAVAELKQKIIDTRLQLQGIQEDQIEAFKDAGRLPSDPTEDQLAGIGVFKVDTTDQNKQLMSLLKTLRENNAELEERERLEGVVDNALKSTMTSTEKLEETLKDLIKARQQNIDKADETIEAEKRIREEIFKQSEAGQAVMEGIGKVSSEIASGIANTITQSGEGLKSFKETFRGFINSILKQLIETRLQAILTSKALELGGGGGGGGLGGFLSSLFGGGSTGTADNYFGYGNFGSFFGGGFYRGGSVSANRSFVVGERGPELFTPRASGMITPNNMMNMAMSGGQTLRGGASGPNITQNFNVTTGVQQTVRAEIMNLMPLIKQESVNAVINGRARGGSIANGLGA